MSHRIHHDLYLADHVLEDPGDGGIIRPDQDLMICEMVTAGGETRTLDDPSKAGIRFVLRLHSDGGDAVVTAANGLNVTGNTIATFEDASDLLSLVSVSHTSGFRWEILENIGAVGLS